MSTLDQWEAEAKEENEKIGLDGILRQRKLSYQLRIVIDLVRKKDEALKALFKDYCSLAESEWSPDWEDIKYMAEKWPLVAKTKEALALTEQLK